MKSFFNITANIILALQVLLIFLLFFQDDISLPVWLQSAGRTHPLLVHLPIGFLLISFLLWLFRKQFEEKNFELIFKFSLQLAALSASLTALMGFFLSKEKGYDEDILAAHKNAGVAFSLLCTIVLWLYFYFPQKKILHNFSLSAVVLLMIIASHFGGELTHGENYVLQPFHKDDIQQLIITDSTPVYDALIQPVLKSKCFSCHNEQKAKGGLIMTDVAKLLKGGKNGPVWVAGDAINSHIIKNINLPLEDEDHMPPKGKSQLTDEEIFLLYHWIQLGADLKKPVKEYDQKDTFTIQAVKFIAAKKDMAETKPAYPFAAAKESDIKKLNEDAFLTVKPVAKESPALTAEFFVRQRFSLEKLKQLNTVKQQLIELNLSNMPVKDEDIKLIAPFSNLEKLFLNNTDITGKTLGELNNLKNLQLLSLSGTKMDNSIANIISLFPSLKELFLWNTSLTETQVADIQKQFTKISVNYGYVPDSNEVLKLTPPIIVNDSFILAASDSIILKNNLPGVQIRYTLDGKNPDSIQSPLYTKPISLNGFTLLRARSYKPGWLSSDSVERYFFSKGFMPQSGELLNAPNDQYKGSGITGLTDNKKGEITNFRDPAWLGYREKSFAAVFYFGEIPPAVSTVTISYGVNVPAYITPPASIEIWASNDKTNYKLLKKHTLAPLTKSDMNKTGIDGIKIDLPAVANFKYYKVQVQNVASLPAWHGGKGQKGWFFVDEIFFN